MSINQLQHSGALYHAAQRIHIKAERKRGRMLVDVQIVFYLTFPYEALDTDSGRKDVTRQIRYKSDLNVI